MLTIFTGLTQAKSGFCGDVKQIEFQPTDWCVDQVPTDRGCRDTWKKCSLQWSLASVILSRRDIRKHKSNAVVCDIWWAFSCAPIVGRDLVGPHCGTHCMGV